MEARTYSYINGSPTKEASPPASGAPSQVISRTCAGMNVCLPVDFVGTLDFFLEHLDILSFTVGLTFSQSCPKKRWFGLFGGAHAEEDNTVRQEFFVKFKDEDLWSPLLKVSSTPTEEGAVLTYHGGASPGSYSAKAEHGDWTHSATLLNGAVTGVERHVTNGENLCSLLYGGKDSVLVPPDIGDKIEQIRQCGSDIRLRGVFCQEEQVHAGYGCFVGEKSKLEALLTVNGKLIWRLVNYRKYTHGSGPPEETRDISVQQLALPEIKAPSETAQPSLSPQQLIQKSFSEGFHKLCGLTLLEAENGRSRVKLDYSPALDNVWGCVHGGVLYTLADAALGMAVFTLLQEGETSVTTDARIDYLKAALPHDAIIAEASIIKRGATLATGDVDIKTLDGTVLAIFRGQFIIRKTP